MGKTKTNVNKVELNYYNNDEHNRFKELIKFPTVYCIKFANVLCQNEKMVNRYIRDYYSPEFEQWEIVNSLQKLKRDLKAERTNVSEYKEKIKNCIETNNSQWLWMLLQDLFLEVLYKEQLDEIIELIHNDVNEEDVMKWYEKDKKILAMTTFSVEYIKSVTSN